MCTYNDAVPADLHERPDHGRLDDRVLADVHVVAHLHRDECHTAAHCSAHVRRALVAIEIPHADQPASDERTKRTRVRGERARRGLDDALLADDALPTQRHLGQVRAHHHVRVNDGLRRVIPASSVQSDEPQTRSPFAVYRPTLPRRWMLRAPQSVLLRLTVLPVDVWMYAAGSNCASGASTYGFILLAPLPFSCCVHTPSIR